MNYFLVETKYVKQGELVIYHNFIKSHDDVDAMIAMLKEEIPKIFNEALKIAGEGKLISVDVEEIDEMSYMRQHFSKENKRKQAMKG
ncbi:hypothetical protein COM55_06235 [Bacillus pseudomycoides]|uniref:hypothetical protein n=1 Tax=Bacillus pseudomycoides TaxID=64104 RepID=UPI000BEF530E|nr:hypothetical protein [Bacillus pseudomycoides]PEK65566.1 hypothetical protein CN590_18025 [Bacillus pseudomycoides]PGE87371.1 hypothetical protein COM55_06235 [Bacillus pseudomycoides]